LKISLCLPIAIRKHETQRAAMLVQCLESVLAQTHQDYEVILKDAFPEESVKLHANVRECMEKFGDRLNYVACPDKGIFDGLNQALWWAKGDILHFICGDDTAGDPDALAFVDETFRVGASQPWSAKQTPSWLYGSLGTILEDGSEGHWGVTPHATLAELLIHNRMGCPAVFWNRQMFDKIGYFEYTMAGDYDYWCRCYRVCGPMYTERRIATGRRWEQSASHVNRETTDREAAEISAKHSAAYARGESPIYVPYNS
jgi:glycosyltransferase involved in cell wall biosynthesis